MKHLLLLLFIISSLHGVTQELSVDEWREDLRYLQQTVNSKYSKLLYKTSQHKFDQSVEDLYTEIPEFSSNPSELLMSERMELLIDDLTCLKKLTF